MIARFSVFIGGADIAPYPCGTLFLSVVLHNFQFYCCLIFYTIRVETLAANFVRGDAHSKVPKQVP